MYYTIRGETRRRSDKLAAGALLYRWYLGRFTRWCTGACLHVQYIVVQVPTTQLAKMSIDPKFVELTADILKIFL